MCFHFEALAREWGAQIFQFSMSITCDRCLKLVDPLHSYLTNHVPAKH